MYNKFLVSNNSNINSKPINMDALIDKKLAEKKQSLAQNNPSNTKKLTNGTNVGKK